MCDIHSKDIWLCFTNYHSLTMMVNSAKYSDNLHAYFHFVGLLFFQFY